MLRIALLGRVIGCTLALTLAGWPARAQAPKDLPRAELSGKIVKLGAGTIEIKTDGVQLEGERKPKQKAAKNKEPAKRATETVVVALHPKNSSVRVSGTASGKFLRAGQYVRFSGKLEPNDKVADEITSVEVFVPDASFKPMLEISLPAPKFASDAPNPKTRDFKVAGRVLAYQRGQLTVLVDGGKRITAPVSESAQVNFTVMGLAGAKPGDTINVEGRLVAPGRVFGERVLVSVASEERKERTKQKAEPKKKAKEPLEAKEKPKES